jgi:hypothetical protein
MLHDDDDDDDDVHNCCIVSHNLQQTRGFESSWYQHSAQLTIASASGPRTPRKSELHTQ